MAECGRNSSLTRPKADVSLLERFSTLYEIYFIGVVGLKKLDRLHMHSASIEFHCGASLCRTSRCNLFLHWSCSWPPFLLHSRNRPARLQHIEMCQSRHSALGLGNASKAALLGQPRITAPNLFIPVTFVGYPLIPPRVRESKRAWRRRDLMKAGGR